MTRFKKLQIALVIQFIVLVLTILGVSIVAHKLISQLIVSNSRILAQDLGSMIVKADAMVAEANGPNKNNRELLEVKRKELYESTSSYANTNTKLAKIELISFFDFFGTHQITENEANLIQSYNQALRAYDTLDSSIVISKKANIMMFDSFDYNLFLTNLNYAKSQLQQLNEQLAKFEGQP